MGKSIIYDVTQTYRLVEKTFPGDLSDMISSGYRSRGDNDLKIIVRSEAVRELFRDISWGQMTKKNRKEQGGILAGHFCKDSSEEGREVIWVEVCHIISCANPKESGNSFIHMSAENWADMSRKLDRLNEEENSELVPVGWYHTHPRDIPAAYSNIDYETQAQKCEYPYSIGIVFNPNRKTWKAYYGPDSTECESYLMTGEVRNRHDGYRYRDRNEIPGRMEVSMRPDVRKNGRDFKIFQYDWYTLGVRRDFQRRLFDRPMIERIRMEPLPGRSFRDLMCAVAGMLKRNLDTMGDMDDGLEGILLEGILLEEYGHYKLKFVSSYFYHDPQELLKIRGSREPGKIAVLAAKSESDFFHDNSIMWNLMTNWGAYTFVLCSPQTDLYSSRYGFEILMKE